MRCLPLVAVLLLAAGCTSVESRLQENPSIVSHLDEATLARIRGREIAVGDSEDVVRLALGQPVRTTPAPDGGVTWLYRDGPHDPNDYVANGFRHHIEFDPVLRTSVMKIDPVGAHMYPQLRTHTTRVSFRGGRVVDVKITED